MPEGSYKTLDPKMVRNATGTFHLEKAIAGLNATGAYPMITVDMDGQSRKQPLQVGADQISKETVIARILTPELVGYKAK
ncbi:hypothetical protein D3C72_2173760 [compost metagenome]